MEILFVIGLLTLFGILAYFNYQEQKKRKEALCAFALAQGLTFTPDKDFSIPGQFPFFPALHQGHSQYAFNILQGAYKNHPLKAFDYHYAVTTRNSKGRSQTHHYYFSAVILTVGFPLKQLNIRPENFLDKVGEFIGLNDIDFESAEFSRKFFVSARDKKFAYGIIHQGMMEYLLAHPGYSIQMDRNEILIYQGKTFSLEELTQCLDLGMGFVENIPAYLIQELKTTSSLTS